MFVTVKSTSSDWWARVLRTASAPRAPHAPHAHGPIVSQNRKQSQYITPPRIIHNEQFGYPPRTAASDIEPTTNDSLGDAALRASYPEYENVSNLLNTLSVDHIAYRPRGPAIQQYVDTLLASLNPQYRDAKMRRRNQRKSSKTSKSPRHKYRQKRTKKTAIISSSPSLSPAPSLLPDSSRSVESETAINPLQLESEREENGEDMVNGKKLYSEVTSSGGSTSNARPQKEPEAAVAPEVKPVPVKPPKGSNGSQKKNGARNLRDVLLTTVSPIPHKQEPVKPRRNGRQQRNPRLKSRNQPRARGNGRDHRENESDKRRSGRRGSGRRETRDSRPQYENWPQRMGQCPDYPYSRQPVGGHSEYERYHGMQQWSGWHDGRQPHREQYRDHDPRRYQNHPQRSNYHEY